MIDKIHKCIFHIRKNGNSFKIREEAISVETMQMLPKNIFSHIELAEIEQMNNDIVDDMCKTHPYTVMAV